MIHVVIPVHNRVALTLKCLEHLLKQSCKYLEIYVVNDGSTDETQIEVAKQYPKVNIFNGSGGLFWTGGVHFAINKIRRGASENDWILLLNNDFFLESNAIENLLEEAENQNRRALCNAISLRLDDSDTVIKSGTIVQSWFFNATKHIYDGSSYGEIKNLDPVEADFLTGRCLLHPIEIFDAVGNYDSYNFIHYGGDDEFTFRIKKYGYRCLVVPRAKGFLNTSSTGNSGSIKKVGIVAGLKSFFEIRSSNNLIVKWRFAKLVAPGYARLSYYFFSIIKSFYIVFFRGR